MTDKDVIIHFISYIEKLFFNVIILNSRPADIYALV